MKKLYSSIVMLSMCALALTSCGDDDDPVPAPTPNPTPSDTIPTPSPVSVTEGVFIIGSGNTRATIDGNVTAFDYATGTHTLNAFQAANGRSLGLNANDAVVYGSKMYIIVTKENTVEVVDKKTMRSIKQIKTTDLMGEDKGKQPRHATTYNGQVLLSTYDGYVAAIDTTDYHLANTYQAGSYPEGLAVIGNTLYVANSDYGKNQNASISKIDLTTGTSTQLKDALITNPVSFAVVGNTLYFLDSGTYDAAYNQSGAGVRKLEGNKVTYVTDATMMSAYGSKIYVYNAPYSSVNPVTPTYGVYDTTKGTLTHFTCPDVKSPAAIAVDPVKDYLFVASYNTDPETGYTSYKTNGYVVVYKSDMTKLYQFETGVGPTAIVFNKSVIYE